MSRVLNKTFLFRLIFFMLLALVCMVSTAYAQSSSQRLSGADRYKTAVSISQEGWKTSDYVVLVRGDDFADALCAGPLAKKYNAPILLTKPNELNTETLNEIKRLSVKSVIIVGGIGAVSYRVENSLRVWGIKEIERISGSDRFDTSIKIAEKLDYINKIIVATGNDYPDALSVSVVASKSGIPILLTNKQSVPDKVKEFIKGRHIEQTYIIGGSGAISDTVKNMVPNPKRIYGASRYETNVAVMQEFSGELNFEKIYLATGEGTNGDGFADALTGAVLAARTSSPLVLLNKSLSWTTQNYIKNKLGLGSKVVALGGEGVVPSKAVNNINILKEQIPVSAKYDRIGSYGPMTNTVIINGNAIISAADVTLQNTIIEGDLLLSESIGNGSVYLRNVVVKGRTFVNGGGPNSVVMYNFNGQTVVVDVPDGGNVRLLAQGSSNIPTVIMNSSGRVEELNVNGSGFTTVEIPEGAHITLSGSFSTVNVDSNGARLNVESGSISSLNVSGNGANASIDIRSGASVSSLEAMAPVTVSGTGPINSACIRSDGVYISQRPGTVNVDSGRSAVVGGSIVSSGSSFSGFAGGGGGGGFSGGNNEGNSNTLRPAPSVENLTWSVGGTAGKIKQTGTVAANTFYVVGAAGQYLNPNAGQGKPSAYSSSLEQGTEIAVTTGQHIFIVTVDGSGNVTNWSDVSVADANIAAGDIFTDNLTFADGSAEGTTKQIHVLTKTYKYVVAPAGSITRPGIGTDTSAYTGTLAQNADITIAEGGANHIFIVQLDDSNKLAAWKEITILDNEIKDRDTIPPDFADEYPKVINAGLNQFDLLIKANEQGTAYFVVVPDGDAKPSVTEVKAGKAKGGVAAIASGSTALSADITEAVTITTNIEVGTDYDIYVVVEDERLNIQVSATLIEVKTRALAPQVGSLSWSVGGAFKTKQTGNTAANTYYTVGTAGAHSNPGLGVVKPDIYSNVLIQNTEISILPGQHIFIVAVDGSGNVTNWSDVAVADENIGVGDIFTDIIAFADGSAIGTRKETNPLTRTYKYIVGPQGSITRPGIGSDISAYTGTLIQNADIAIQAGQTNYIFIVELDNSNRITAWKEIALPVIECITYSDTSHIYGTTSTVAFDVDTIGILDGSTVIVELVTQAGQPLAPRLQVAGTINNNMSEVLYLTIPGNTDVGYYGFKVSTSQTSYIFEASYNIKPARPTYVNNTFVLKKDEVSTRAELELTQALTTFDYQDFYVAGSNPDGSINVGTAVQPTSGYVSGKKVVLNFENDTVKNAVMGFGAGAQLYTKSSPASKNASGIALLAFTSESAKKVWDDQIKPELTTMSIESGVASYVNVIAQGASAFDGSVNSAATTCVVLKFTEELDNTIAGLYQDDFTFTQEGELLDVDSVAVNGQYLVYYFKPTARPVADASKRLTVNANLTHVDIRDKRDLGAEDYNYYAPKTDDINGRYWN